MLVAESEGVGIRGKREPVKRGKSAFSHLFVYLFFYLTEWNENIKTCKILLFDTFIVVIKG